VFSVSTGIQYQLTEALSLRCGYLYTQNPTPDENAFYNVAAPAIYEHMIAIGASLRLTCRTSLSIAFLRAFENSIEGFVPPETGVPANTVSVGTSQAINALVAGLQVRF
jgi:long-chain fatty acid transport protein